MFETFVDNRIQKYIDNSLNEINLKFEKIFENIVTDNKILVTVPNIELVKGNIQLFQSY